MRSNLSLDAVGMKYALDTSREEHHGNGYKEWRDMYRPKPGSKRMTKGEIAAAMGVSRMTLRNWERVEGRHKRKVRLERKYGN